MEYERLVLASSTFGCGENGWNPVVDYFAATNPGFAYETSPGVGNGVKGRLLSKAKGRLV